MRAPQFMWVRKLATCAAVALLAGCSAMPNADKALPKTTEVTQDLEKRWAAIPAERVIEGSTGMNVRPAYPLPQHLAERNIQLRLKARMELGQVVAALSSQGIKIVYRGSAEKQKEPVEIPYFSGTLKTFLESLAVIHSLNYEYVNDVIVLSQGIRYMVTVPQSKDLMSRLPDAMEALGASGVKTDIDAGIVTFNADLLSIRDLGVYIDRVANNAAMVALQVAVIDVRLNRDFATGFDWNEFGAMWGSNSALFKNQGTGGNGNAGGTGLAPGSTPVPTNPNQGGTPPSGSGTNAGTGATPVQRVLGTLLSVTGASAGLKFDGGHFSLTTAIRLLSKYGAASTTQDVMLSTMSGTPVKINSGSQIPYVKSVGAVAAPGGAVQGSAQTATVNSGLTIEIVPRYDRSEGAVVTNVEAKLSSLVRFRELSAGTNVGTLSQPEIQELGFENISRLKPGEVIMLGGIAYDQESDNYTSLPGMEKRQIGSESKVANRHAIFIVIRPSVTVFAASSKGLTQ